MKIISYIISHHSIILGFAAEHAFGVVLTLFTLGPWPEALSCGAVIISTKTISISLWCSIAVPPTSFDVVLRNGSAGRVDGPPLIRIVIREWPVAEFVTSWHAKVLAFFIQPLLAAQIWVLVDCFVLATIFCDINIAFVPAITALGTLDIGAFAFIKAWSYISPNKYVFLLFFLFLFVFLFLLFVFLFLFVFFFITFVRVFFFGFICPC